MDLICCLCLLLSFLFPAAFGTPVCKGLTSSLSYGWYFLVSLSPSANVFWVRCGTQLYRFLIFGQLVCIRDTDLMSVWCNILSFFMMSDNYMVSLYLYGHALYTSIARPEHICGDRYYLQIPTDKVYY